LDEDDWAKAVEDRAKQMAMMAAIETQGLSRYMRSGAHTLRDDDGSRACFVAIVFAHSIWPQKHETDPRGRAKRAAMNPS